MIATGTDVKPLEVLLFMRDVRSKGELDHAFVAHLVQHIEAQRPDLKPIDQDALNNAFQSFGRRPQFFMAALGHALSPVSGVTERFEIAMLAAAEQRQRDDEQQMASDFLGLKPLERAVLWRMLEQGPRFRPYHAEALRFYKDKTGDSTTAGKVQTALEGLRQRQPSLIWKSARSEYTVEDAAMHRWYTQCVAAGAWPPAGPQLDWIEE